MQHFMELLNQPGSAVGFEKYLPAQRGLHAALEDPFTWDELMTALKKMKGGRATGLDGLPIEVEKFIFSDEMLVLLLDDFNSALLLGKQEWKDAVISILFKKGSPALCDNYRGLSLINHTGKLLERMLQNRLLPFALEAGLVPWGQFGFLAGVGTADAQGLAAHLADSAAEQGLKTFRAFVDLTKAYDKVDRDALWLILQRAGVPPRFVALVKDLHVGARAAVRHGGQTSESFPLQRGLKQGSVFAPLLFNIFLGAEYAADASGLELGVRFKWRREARIHRPLPDLQPFNTTNHDFQFVTLSYLAYADDLVLMARSEAALQKMMDIFVRVVDAFGQEVSIAKTKVMVSERVTPANPTRSPATITVHGKPLGLVDSFIYLGCSVAWDGSLDGEIKRRVQRMVAAFSRWRSVLENFDIDIRARLLLFQSVVASNGLYGCETWTVSNAHFNTLDATHFHLLRRTVGPQVYASSQTELLAFIRQVAPEAKIFPLRALAMKRMLRFWGHVARMEPFDYLQAVGARSVPPRHAVVLGAARAYSGKGSCDSLAGVWF